MKHSISAGIRLVAGGWAAGGWAAHRRARRIPLTLLLLPLALVLLGGCAGRDIAEQPPVPAASLPPGLQHSGTQQQFHSFESAGLTFHFTITNPGLDRLQLHSYSYRLEEVRQASSSKLDLGSDSDIALDPDAAREPDWSPLASGRKKFAGRSAPAGGSTSLEIPIQMPLGEPVKSPQPADK